MDFTKVDAAEQNFDAKMAIYKEKDSALAAANQARDAAAADLASKESAVTTAEGMLTQADADAEAALAVYMKELEAVGIKPGSAPMSAKSKPPMT